MNHFLGSFGDGDETAELINFHKVLILLPDQFHWIDNFKSFLLVYYMWCFQWILDPHESSWASMKSNERFKPSRQKFNIFKRSIASTIMSWKHIIKTHMLGMI
jgi:hypothetical protein